MKAAATKNLRTISIQNDEKINSLAESKEETLFMHGFFCWSIVALMIRSLVYTANEYEYTQASDE